MSPERTNSPDAEEYVATPKMSVPGSPVAGTPVRDAQSSISILLAVAQSQHHNMLGRSADDDLTNLNWLQNRDLLKDMNIASSPSASAQSTPVKTMYYQCPLSDQSPTSDYVDDSSSLVDGSSSSSSLHSPVPSIVSNSQPSPFITSASALSPSASAPLSSKAAIPVPPPLPPPSAPSPGQQQHQRSRHPHNVPYDPLVHTTSKPPYSFSCLIFMAIEDCPHKALPVKEIYAWIVDHFPYFHNAPTGWKNSVRHNLSLNKCFQKVEKAPNLGKGSLWTVDQQFRPNLLQALTRSPYHHCSTLDPSVYLNKIRPDRYQLVNSNGGGGGSSCSRSPLPVAASTPGGDSGHRSASESSRLSERSEDSLDETDAAIVMLSLCNPTRRVFNKRTNTMVITTSPSQDHTYSAAENRPGSSVSVSHDEAFESDDERVQKTRICRKIVFDDKPNSVKPAEDDEEERRIKEGAETLLNLAGIGGGRRRTYSQSSNLQQPEVVKHSRPDDQHFNKISSSSSSGGHRINSEVGDGGVSPRPFRPRMLRPKRSEGGGKSKRQSNKQAAVSMSSASPLVTATSTSAVAPAAVADWAKYRREIQIEAAR